MIDGSKRAVIYVRVSTEEQAKTGTSLATQECTCRELAGRLGATVVSVFSDEGVSGGLYKTRAGVQLAVAAIEDGRADLLLALKIDRVGRRAMDILDIAERVDRAGGSLQTCDGKVFGGSAQGKFMLTMFAAVAELERETIRERTTAGKKKSLENGKQPCRAMSPFGYHVVSNKDVLSGLYPAGSVGNYIVIPEQAEIVRDMFRMYEGGMSLRKVAHCLNERQVPTHRGGKSWNMVVVRDILRNPVYKGLGTYGKRKRIVDESRLEKGYKRADFNRRKPEVDWLTVPAPAIVGDDTWETCQTRLRDNQQRLSGSPRVVHMLSGFLKCPRCRRKMITKGSRRKYTYYNCRDYGPSCNMDGTVCNPRSYNSETTEQMVVEALLHACNQRDVISAILEEARLSDAEQEFDETAYHRACNEKKQIDAEEAAAIQAQIAGIQAGASATAYASVFARLAERRHFVENSLKAMDEARCCKQPRQGNPDELLSEMLSKVEAVLSSSTLSPATKRELLAGVLEDVVPDGETYHVSLKPPVCDQGCATDRFIVILR